MSSYSEVRRVRSAMSKEAGHDVRRLIAMINERRSRSTGPLIDPGTAAERCDAPDVETKRRVSPIPGRSKG